MGKKAKLVPLFICKVLARPLADRVCESLLMFSRDVVKVIVDFLVFGFPRLGSKPLFFKACSLFGKTQGWACNQQHIVPGFVISRVRRETWNYHVQVICTDDLLSSQTPKPLFIQENGDAFEHDWDIGGTAFDKEKSEFWCCLEDEVRFFNIFTGERGAVSFKTTRTRRPWSGCSPVLTPTRVYIFIPCIGLVDVFCRSTGQFIASWRASEPDGTDITCMVIFRDEVFVSEPQEGRIKVCLFVDLVT